MKSKSLEKQTKIKCPHCKKALASEDALIKHYCEKKRRWLEKDSTINKVAFYTFQRFHNLNFPGKKEKNYEEFMNSRYYTSFINFSRHINSLDYIDKSQYIDYVIKHQIPLSNWSHTYVYEGYVKDKVLRESIDDAFIRSLQVLEEWSEEEEISWREFYNRANTSYIKILLKSGKLSPWIIFLENGEKILERLSISDINEIEFLLDGETWSRKLALNKKRIKQLNELIKG